MNIVKLDKPNLKDVPASLRRLADALEKGEEPASERAIVVSVDAHGEIRVYGYGLVGTRACEIGTLCLAAAKLSVSS